MDTSFILLFLILFNLFVSLHENIIEPIVVENKILVKIIDIVSQILHSVDFEGSQIVLWIDGFTFKGGEFGIDKLGENDGGL